jgi:hypothetical protein
MRYTTLAVPVFALSVASIFLTAHAVSLGDQHLTRDRDHDEGNTVSHFICFFFFLTLERKVGMRGGGERALCARSRGE